MTKSSFSAMLRFMLALFVGALSGCGNDNGLKIDISKNSCRDENNPRKVHVNLTGATLNINACGAVESIVVLDSTEPIGTIDKIQVDGNSIYILDKRKAKAIFCYSFDGKLKWKYSRQGRGPGNYLQLGDMHVQNKEVYVFDERALKIIELDTSGAFVKELSIVQNKRFFPDELFVDDDQHVILYNFDTGDYEFFPYEMVVMDPSCKKMLSYHLLKSHNPSVKRWGSQLSPMQYFSNNKGFYFTKAMNDTIYGYQRGVFSREYVIDFGSNGVPEKIRQQNVYTLRDFSASSYEGNIERVIENDSLISFMFAKGNKPAYTFFDKQTLQSKSYALTVFNIDQFYQMLMPLGSWNGRIIASVQPMELLQFCQYYKKNNPGLTDGQLDSKLKKEMPVLYAISKQISVSSNPVLVFITVSRNKLFSNAKI